MDNPKYIVFPGYIRNAKTGRRTFISGEKLVDLWGVPREECWIAESPPEAADIWMTNGRIALGPDPTGKYEMKEEAA